MAGILTFVCLGLSIALLLCAALHDAATRTIPNGIPAGLVAIGLIQRFYAGEVVTSLVAAGVLIVLLGLLWLRGFVGGGDAKLIPAASLLLPTLNVPGYVLAVAIAGGILAVLYWALSNVVPRPHAGQRTGFLARLAKAEMWRLHRRGPLPYAVAISAGALVMIGKAFYG